MNNQQTLSAAAAGTFTIGGDLTVNRMGYGAMRITGARRVGTSRRQSRCACDSPAGD